MDCITCINAIFIFYRAARGIVLYPPTPFPHASRGKGESRQIFEACGTMCPPGMKDFSLIARFSGDHNLEFCSGFLTTYPSPFPQGGKVGDFLFPLPDSRKGYEMG